jgi:uncharacterized membrane protein
VFHHLPTFFRHVVYNLRGGFLVRPLAIALVLGFAGAGLSTLEEVIPALQSLAPRLLFPSHDDPQVAQVILSTIASSMMTVVSIVFAILLMTITLTSTQFSPRVIISFVQDRVTQQTLGIFVGTFAYCLSALPAARSTPHPFSPVLTVCGAMLLALACVVWLLFFIHHISQAVSVNHLVDRIARETETVIDVTMPRLRQDGERAPVTAPPEPTEREATVPCAESGYIRFIDVERLAVVARSYNVAVRVLRRVGHFVPQGVPLMSVTKGERITPVMSAELSSAFDFGPTRTLEQDVEFGILQIVDIALKAISPAVNDPSTAIGCIDQLSRILIRHASREPADSVLFDPPGVARVVIIWPSFERLVEAAFEQIRLYSTGDVAVSLRLLRALRDVATTTEVPQYRRALVECGRRVLAGCAQKLGDDELREMRVRLTALEALAAVD